MTQVIMVRDRTPPIFSRIVEDTTVECDCDDFEPVADIDAIDNCDTEGDNLVFSETSELGTCDQSFEITREWIATDACGNAATLTQNVLVEDNTPPLFCDDFCDEDCVDDVEVVADDPEEIDADFIDCDNDKRIVYGWTATDDCGNTEVCSTTIDIEDTTPPECTNC